MLGGAAIIAAGMVRFLLVLPWHVRRCSASPTRSIIRRIIPMLAHHVAPERIGQAFSSFTPSPGCSARRWRRRSLLILHAYVGWRGAFVAAGILGIHRRRDPDACSATRPGHHAAKPKTRCEAGRLEPAAVAPILLNLRRLYVVCCLHGRLEHLSGPALNVLHHMPLPLGNLALTTLLFSLRRRRAPWWRGAQLHTRHVVIAAASLSVVAVAVGACGHR